ncbi:hypothetical protein B0H14DRAFT_2600979 [Mycena olivaceomarginata]|nr:hypothetical protein B0H14DRAFT_2600979 [Mycena olivaceomarginata]
MFPKKLPKGQKSSKERVMTVTGSCLAKRSEHGPQQVGIHENTQKQVPLHYAVMRSCTCAAANPSTRITGECDDEEYRRGFDRVSGNRKTESVWEELARAGGSGGSGPYIARSARITGPMICLGNDKTRRRFASATRAINGDQYY